MLLILLSAVSLKGFAQTTQWLTVSNDLYTVQYPDSWTHDSSRNMGTELIFYSPFENVKDQFKENVNLLIQHLNGQKIDLLKYKQITDEQLKELGGEDELIASKIIKTPTGEYYRLEHIMKQAERTLHFTSVCVIRNETAYLLTFTAEQSSYLRFKNEGETIMSSFRLKNPAVQQKQ